MDFSMKDPPPQRRGGDARPQKSGEKRGRMRKSSPPPTTPSLPPSLSLRQSVVRFVRIGRRRESGVSEFTFHILREGVFMFISHRRKTLSRAGGKEEDEKCVFIGVPRTFVLLFGP